MLGNQWSIFYTYSAQSTWCPSNYNIYRIYDNKTGHRRDSTKSATSTHLWCESNHGKEISVVWTRSSLPLDQPNALSHEGIGAHYSVQLQYSLGSQSSAQLKRTITRSISSAQLPLTEENHQNPMNTQNTQILPQGSWRGPKASPPPQQCCKQHAQTQPEVSVCSQCKTPKCRRPRCWLLNYKQLSGWKKEKGRRRGRWLSGAHK